MGRVFEMDLDKVIGKQSVLYQEDSAPLRLDESKIKGADLINQINHEMNDKLDVSYFPL